MTSGRTWQSALVRGTVLSLVMRWSVKLLGLASLVVLARLLSPDDYGVMALAIIVLELLETILNSSAEAALLRHPEADRETIDSAWTMRLLQCTAIAAGMLALAPFAAHYFGEPRLTMVLVALSAGIVISGFANIGPILARKGLDFGLEVRISVQSKIVSVAVNIAAAFWLRNYWALVIGGFSGYVATTLLSYYYHPYRPRWCLRRFRELWGFSQWLLVSGIGSFFSRQIDQMWVARVGTSDQLGTYKMASDLAQLVTIELSAPMNRALYPVMSSLQANPQQMRSALLRTLGAINTVTLPASLGLAAVAVPAVAVLLGGDKWAAVAPFLTVFAAAGAFRFVVSPYYVYFMTIGKSWTLAVVTWLEAVIFVAAAWPLTQQFGIMGLAWARVAATAAAILTWLVMGHRNGLTLSALMGAVWRPMAAALVMTAVIVAMPAHWFVLPAIELAAKIGIGATVYAAAAWSLWAIAGFPDGTERFLLGKAQSLLARLKGS